MTFSANTGAFADVALTELQRPVSPTGFLSRSHFDPIATLQAQPKEPKEPKL